MSKKKEVHITVTEETGLKLDELVVNERRSKRAIVTKMIDDAHDKLKKDKK